MNSTLLQINDGCSATCQHCPYAKRIASHQTIPTLIAEMEGFDYLVVTGGEPLEHPELTSILNLIDQKEKFFRLATGGHRNLINLIPLLQRLTFCAGVSLGTDILIPERNSHTNLAEVWQCNVDYLKVNAISFSFSITLGQDFQLAHLLKRLSHLPRPAFVMLSEMQGQQIDKKIWHESCTSIKHILGVEVYDGYRN
jgi:hypothetical protein